MVSKTVYNTDWDNSIMGSFFIVKPFWMLAGGGVGTGENHQSSEYKCSCIDGFVQPGNYHYRRWDWF